MTATNISRMEFTRTDPIEDDRAQLANEARRYLGYHKLAQAVTMPDALMCTLRRIGMEPLVRSQVEAYQRSKAKNGMWSGHKYGIAWLMAMLATAWAWSFLVLPALNPPMAEGSRFAPEPEAWAIFCTIAAFICTVVFGIHSCVRLLHKGYLGTRKVRNWRACAIPSYTGNIPEFALSKAVELKRELSGVGFQIEYLTETHEKIEKPLPDPFLVAVLGDEKYYLDVWDEKEYEQRM